MTVVFFLLEHSPDLSRVHSSLRYFSAWKNLKLFRDYLTSLDCLFTVSFIVHGATNSTYCCVFSVSPDSANFLKMGVSCPVPGCTPTLRPYTIQ